jgi:glyoxylase-like metal-dependent hydrolase (beta-lactamase superfamily II)
MIIKSFVFGPFSENTYVLHDETTQCVIIDAGCSNVTEQQEIVNYIKTHGLIPVKLLNTHTHIDHILGNHFIYETYQLTPEFSKADIPTFRLAEPSAKLWGINYTPSPEPQHFIEEGDTIQFGNQTLDIIFTPGHSHGSICFIHHASRLIISGDVLFNGSIGRTDLPGGNLNTLLTSIKTKLMMLPHDYDVYPGHGPKTTIGYERKFNPFLD